MPARKPSLRLGVWKTAAVTLVLLAGALLLSVAHVQAETPAAPAPINDSNPFGVGSSAEWSSAYPKF
jgi:hypothetical protein